MECVGRKSDVSRVFVTSCSRDKERDCLLSVTRRELRDEIREGNKKKPDIEWMQHEMCGKVKVYQTIPVSVFLLMQEAEH